MACKKFWTVALMFAIMFLLSESVSAMTFSQPVKIGGGVRWSQVGGFYVSDDAKSNSVEKNYYRSGKVHGFSKGVAQFGTGKNIVYEHYDYEKYKTAILIGGENETNTFKLESIENGFIYFVENDTPIEIYMIQLGNDIHEEDGYLIFGKRADGHFVKYFDTYEITKKFFDKWGAVAWGDIYFRGDTITIVYEKRNESKRYGYYKAGEFRFKWDDAAQWFGVEHIVY